MESQGSLSEAGSFTMSILLSVIGAPCAMTVSPAGRAYSQSTFLPLNSLSRASGDHVANSSTLAPSQLTGPQGPILCPWPAGLIFSVPCLASCLCPSGL